MTRQDVKRLVEQFQHDSNEAVELTGAQVDTMSGRMICRWNAQSKDILTGWLEQRNILFRSADEWVMQVQLENGPDGLKPPPAKP